MSLVQALTHSNTHINSSCGLYCLSSSDQSSQRWRCWGRWLSLGVTFLSWARCFTAAAAAGGAVRVVWNPPRHWAGGDSVQGSSKDNSPALESTSESRAAFFISWTLCWESATAASVSAWETLSSSAGVYPPTTAKMPKTVRPPD